MSDRPKILGISGSLRAGSYSTALLEALKTALADRADFTVFRLNDVPMYNQDEDTQTPPAGAAALRPEIDDAAIRLLTRMGVEVVRPAGGGCCGSLTHHMGKEDSAHAHAKQAIDAWDAEIAKGLDAILVTASGCGTTIKDYGFMFRNDPAYAEKAARVSAIAKDVTEYLATLDPPQPGGQGITVAYHSACSMQHGQQIKDGPKLLLKAAGFTVKDPPEGHLCCGSAGTYNIMQPVLATALRDRKVANIEKTRPDIIAAGNIGCITQIAEGFAERDRAIPIVHTVELLDWAEGGPVPDVMRRAGFGEPPLPLAS